MLERICDLPMNRGKFNRRSLTQASAKRQDLKLVRLPATCFHLDAQIFHHSSLRWGPMDGFCFIDGKTGDGTATLNGTSCACLKMRKPRNCILQKGTWWWASKVYQILRHPYEYFTIFQHLSWPVLTMLSNWNVTPWCCIPRCFKYV